jgi:hypothetical protein
MGITVSEDTLAQTTKCEMDFACLSGQASAQCQIESSMESVRFLMVNKIITEPCNYSFRFGDSEFCNCPVRFEMYQHHDI